MKKSVILFGVLFLCIFGKQELLASETKENEYTDKVIFNGTEYCIGKKSLGIDKDFLSAGIERDKIEYSIEVKKGNDIIQVIPYKDSEAAINTISLTDELDEKCLKVEFDWDMFRTMFIGFSAVEYYKISSDGQLILYFRYYKKIGAQDEPVATIAKFEKESNRIMLNYTYFHSVGFPQMGYGTFEITYLIEAGTIQYSDFYSNIIASEFPPRDINSTIEYKIDLSRDALNKTFEYLTGPRNFVY